MDTYTLYAARTIGMKSKQDEYDTQIVKEVWQNKFSNLTEEQSAKACQFVYDSQGSSAYEKCNQAYLSCGTDGGCVSVAQKYAEALAKGYSKDFEAFKKKTNFLTSTGELIGGVLSGFVGSQTGRNNQVNFGTGGFYQPPRRTPAGTYIGIALLAIVGIGAGIYFYRKSKSE